MAHRIKKAGVWIGWVGLTSAALACNGGQVGGNGATDTPVAGGGSGGGPMPGDGPVMPGPVVGDPPVSMPPEGTDPTTLNPGFIQARRLNNTEYNNTVRDLLGTQLRPGDFVQATTVSGFDTNAAALAGINTAIALAYYDGAEDLVNEALAGEASRQALVSCEPAAPGDTACAQGIIGAFAAKAYRRPLAPEELTRLVQLYTDGVTTLELDHAGAVGLVVRTILLSPHFLYRLEIDADIAGTAAAMRPLNGYELASRLSYMLWGTIPDQELTEAAASGELTQVATLQAQTERMLRDPRGLAFAENFFAQWFAVRQLASHDANLEFYPTWSAELKGAMVADAHEFFMQFVTGGRAWSEFLTAPLNTTNPALAALYADDPTPRVGFLGLPAFLTSTSTPERTAPTYRGRLAMEALLCTHIVPPANLEIPPLEAVAEGQTAPANIREMLRQHSEDPTCAACHAALDPIGLGLENYDAIGRYRTAYEDGQPIDASGEISGTPFNGKAELTQVLLNNPKLNQCPSEMLMSYTLGRFVGANDKPYMDQLTAAWNAGDFVTLAKHMVASDTFRFRRLPPEAL